MGRMCSSQRIYRFGRSRTVFQPDPLIPGSMVDELQDRKGTSVVAFGRPAEKFRKKPSNCENVQACQTLAGRNNGSIPAEMSYAILRCYSHTVDAGLMQVSPLFSMLLQPQASGNPAVPDINCSHLTPRTASCCFVLY